MYPIRDTDFWETEKGDFCMSEFYLQEVLKLKLEEGI